jgi:hypothetical protein
MSLIFYLLTARFVCFTQAVLLNKVGDIKGIEAELPQEIKDRLTKHGVRCDHRLAVIQVV